LSPLPYDPQAQTLEGITFGVRKINDTILGEFATTSELGGFIWQTASGANFSIGNWGFGFDNGIHALTFEATDGFVQIDGYNVLTEASLLGPLHFSQISLGTGSSTIGGNSFAAGSGVTANGLNSAAFGVGTTAQGNNQFVIGQYNSLQGSAADALFIVGNGSSAAAPSNAFVVNRNGDTKVSGRLLQGSGSSAPGSGASALGFEAYAYGERSVAIGTWASAYGEDSFSVGSGSVAEGPSSIALGALSWADGNSSLALGNDSIAQGVSSTAFASCSALAIYSTSMGIASEAQGLGSVSIGRNTIAQGLNQVVIGQFNVASGTPHNNWAESNNWDPGDEIFIVGNGQNQNALSNALTVKKNAATGIGTGIVTTTASQTVVGKYNNTSVDAQGNHGAGLFIVGMGSGTGATPRKNALRVREDGTLLVRPAGDLSMGDFQTGEQP
jgi:hypothetical protein